MHEYCEWSAERALPSEGTTAESETRLRLRELPSRPVYFLETRPVKPELAEGVLGNKADQARGSEKRMGSGDHESVPCPGFELATFAMPASRYGYGHDHGRADDEVLFRQAAEVALRPMIEQLPVGASLVTEYVLLPKDHGAQSMSCRVRIETKEQDSPRLTSELAICLATLSDHFGFRAEPSWQGQNDPASYVTCVIRPAGAFCSPGTSKMGFTGDAMATAVLRLPVPEIARQSEPRRADNNRVASLNLFFKAARANRQALRVRIRLARENLPKNTSSVVARLMKQAPAGLADTESTTSHIGQAVWHNVLEGWSDTSGDILRLSVEVDSLAGDTPSGSLLRILAACIFPGYRVEILAKETISQSPNIAIDLAGALPLTGPLPPLLPTPAILEALDYPRHFDNPMVSLSNDGLLLGHTQMGGFERPVCIAEADRSRHVYLLGATGTGKSTLMLNMLRQDMQAGHGVALIDPHGDLFEQVLASVPPERKQDLLIIDPDDPNCSVGLNPFDFDGIPSLAKVNLVINDFLDIFAELWNMAEAGGPIFEQYFRNAFLLACATPENEPPEGLPEGPPTLLTATELMRDRHFRTRLLKNCETSYLGSDVGSEVTRFFQAAVETTGDIGFANTVPYVTSKVTRFTNNPVLRKLLCAPKRTIDFRAAIDRGAIVGISAQRDRSFRKIVTDDSGGT